MTKIMDLFNDFENIFPTVSLVRSEIEQTENGIKLTMSVPGFKREEIEISIENQILKIEGKVEKATSFKKPFTKLYRLHQSLDQDKILAKQEDGILTITLNKLPKELRSKKVIEIS